MPKRDLSNVLATSETTIRDALDLINRNQAGIALVVDEQGRIVRSVTDGDIRRAILKGLEPKDKLADLPPPTNPSTTVRKDTPQGEVLRLMKERTIQQVPVLDDEDRVVDLILLKDILDAEYETPFHALVMAGGFGTRLAPLTADVPKPMLKVGDKPVLEHIIDQLQNSGIEAVSIATHYLPDVITNHFGDGKGFGLSINYVHEDEPLGTAGALRLVDKPTGPILVINGDVLTNIDFRWMRHFHEDHQADLTMAVRPYMVKIPYGVVETEGDLVTAVTEKPTMTYFVNAGIYLLNPCVLDHVGESGRLDMTSLIDVLIANGRRVVTFPLAEYWIDIGQPEHLHQAHDDVANGALTRAVVL
jgi:dTDP-glucose pyrophosphorylase